MKEFDKEEKLRESLKGKTDREVIIEMHVKEERILKVIGNINNKLAGVKDYSKRLASLERKLTSSVDNLSDMVEDSLGELQFNLIDSSDIESAVKNVIKEEMDSKNSESDNMFDIWY